MIEHDVAVSYVRGTDRPNQSKELSTRHHVLKLLPESGVAPRRHDDFLCPTSGR
jgi:hypothetical protein